MRVDKVMIALVILIMSSCNVQKDIEIDDAVTNETSELLVSNEVEILTPNETTVVESESVEYYYTLPECQVCGEFDYGKDIEGFYFVNKGKKLQLLDDHLEEWEVLTSISMSPNEKYVALTTGGDNVYQRVWVIDLNTDENWVIGRREGVEFVNHPVWGPDSRLAVIEGLIDDSHIVIYDFNNHINESLGIPDYGGYLSIKWSNEGDYIDCVKSNFFEEGFILQRFSTDTGIKFGTINISRDELNAWYDSSEVNRYLIELEEKLQTDNIDESINAERIDTVVLEENIRKAATIIDLYDLKKCSVDGATAIIYGGKLVEIYRRLGIDQFLNEVVVLEDRGQRNELLEDLASYYYGLDAMNDSAPNFTQEVLIYINENELDEDEYEMVNILLPHPASRIMQMDYNEQNIFASTWYLKNYNMERYKESYLERYKGDVLETKPQIFVSSSLESEDYTYEKGNMTDFDLSTAWSEGIKGYGIGEKITFIIPKGHEDTEYEFIDIVNGYIKTDVTWEENARIKTLKYSVNGEFMGLIQLYDNKELQRILLKDLEVGPEEVVLEFEILDVYPGSKYEDVLITEFIVFS